MGRTRLPVAACSVPKAGVIRSPSYSRGKAKEGSHFLPRRPPAQTLAGTVVDKNVDTLEFRPPNFSEGRLLGIEPADQAVRVLIGAPLPRVVGVGEKHVHAGVPRNFFMLGKLLAVVESEAQPRLLG